MSRERILVVEDDPAILTGLVDLLEGELVTGEDRQLSGRVWVHSMDVKTPSGISDGDVVRIEIDGIGSISNPVTAG